MIGLNAAPVLPHSRQCDGSRRFSVRFRGFVCRKPNGLAPPPSASPLPAHLVTRAQRLRRWFAEQARELFRKVDVLIAPATPDVAPFIGQKMMRLAGVEVPVRAALGLYTQPISFIGLPVVVVPVWND